MRYNKDLILSLIAVLIIILVGILVGYLLFRANNIYYSVNNMMDEKGLVMEIHYNNLECDPVKLEVYYDNTYRFYKNSSSFPSLGKYDYNIINIIKNSSKGTEGPYLITSGSEINFSTDKNNLQLKEFLDSINIDLEQCITN